MYIAIFYAVQSGTWLPKFWKNLRPQSSALKMEQQVQNDLLITMERSWKGRTRIEGVREQDAKENICA
jgi:hypothetical protein